MGPLDSSLAKSVVLSKTTKIIIMRSTTIDAKEEAHGYGNDYATV